MLTSAAGQASCIGECWQDVYGDAGKNAFGDAGKVC